MTPIPDLIRHVRGLTYQIRNYVPGTEDELLEYNFHLFTQYARYSVTRFIDEIERLQAENKMFHETIKARFDESLDTIINARLE